MNYILQDLFLEITMNCNANCNHCGSGCSKHKKFKNLPIINFINVINLIIKEKKHKNLRVHITGGEPFTRKDLEPLFKVLHNNKIQWGIVTNGTLFDNKILTLLYKYQPNCITISVDDLYKKHDELRQIKNGFNKIINFFKNNNTYFNIEFVTTFQKSNINKINDLHHFFKSIGLKYWRLNLVDPIGKSKNSNHLLQKEQCIKLLEFVKKHNDEKMNINLSCQHFLGKYENLRKYHFKCLAGKTIGSILYNGDIYVCPSVPRIKSLIQGNILKDDFVKIWQHKFIEFRNGITSCKDCKSCNKWELCQGDSLHTWDFIKNHPLFCIKRILKD